MFDFDVLVKKARNPKKLTDRELAQLRRSSRLPPSLLYTVVFEQARRGLLVTPTTSNRLYLPEKRKRISDYPEDQISPRLY